MGPAMEERFCIAHCARTNFSNWKYWKHGIGSTLAALRNHQDVTAVALLIHCVTGSYLEYKNEATTAKQIWERPCSTFKPRSMSNKLYL